MFITLFITFREFLEAFLIVGMFLGISRTLQLQKEKEILLAAGSGMLLALLLPIFVYSTSAQVTAVLSEQTADILEGYIMLFSGCFIAYIVLSLHDFFQKHRNNAIAKAKEKLQTSGFDITLFLTISFFILREGFEIALFTATSALFSTFIQNMLGLLFGFAASACIGLLVANAYIRFPLKRVFQFTEYFIILLGAAMVKNGLTAVLANNFHIALTAYLGFTIPFFSFLQDTVIGNLLYSFAGVEKTMSLLQLFIMAVYVCALIFILSRKHPHAARH